MNKNDSKKHRPQKGLVDPHSIQEFTVYHEAELLPFLFEKLPQQSKKNVKRILSNHQVSVGGAPVTQFNFKLYPEDVVVISKNRIAKHERKELPIIYEDQDLIAIDKPSGLLSVATEKEKGRTAYRLVSDYITQTNPKARIFVVHRLDEDTSGVLVFAKNWETREALQNSWQDIIKDRRYYAIVEGQMEKKEDTLRDYLDQDRAQLVYVTHNKDKGKLAITSYSVLAAKKEYSLLDVTIDSGRKNQIRVQLGNIGHYVIGDDKYGEPSNPIKRLGLHAYKLAFTNPLNGKEYTFTAPMPASFKSMFFNPHGERKDPLTPARPYEKPRPRYERKGLHGRRHRH